MRTGLQAIQHAGKEKGGSWLVLSAEV